MKDDKKEGFRIGHEVSFDFDDRRVEGEIISWRAEWGMFSIYARLYTGYWPEYVYCCPSSLTKLPIKFKIDDKVYFNDSLNRDIEGVVVGWHETEEKFKIKMRDTTGEVHLLPPSMLLGLYTEE